MSRQTVQRLGVVPIHLHLLRFGERKLEYMLGVIEIPVRVVGREQKWVASAAGVEDRFKRALIGRTLTGTKMLQ